MISIVRQGVTRADADAVVTAANEGLRAGGGVCGAVFEEAGYDEMRAACAPILRFAADAAAIGAHDDFCPICAGLFTSDVPAAAPPTPILHAPAASPRFAADAAPIRFFPLPPGRAPPAPRA